MIMNIRDFLNLDPKQMVGLTWPPASETKRIARYAVYEGIWNGEHERVLTELNLVENHELYIAVNLPKNLVLSPADIMGG